MVFYAIGPMKRDGACRAPHRPTAINAAQHAASTRLMMRLHLILCVLSLSAVACLLGDRTSFVLKNPYFCKSHSAKGYETCLMGLLRLPNNLVHLLNASMNAYNKEAIALIAMRFIDKYEIAFRCGAAASTLKEAHICLLQELHINDDYISLLECVEEYDEWLAHGPIVFSTGSGMGWTLLNGHEFMDTEVLRRAALKCQETFKTQTLRYHLTRINGGEESEIRHLLINYEHMLSKVLYPKTYPEPTKPSHMIAALVRHYTWHYNIRLIINEFNARFDWSLVPIAAIRKILIKFEKAHMFPIVEARLQTSIFTFEDIFSELWPIAAFRRALLEACEKYSYIGEGSISRIEALESIQERSLSGLIMHFLDMKKEDIRKTLGPYSNSTLLQSFAQSRWDLYKSRLTETLIFIKALNWHVPDDPQVAEILYFRMNVSKSPYAGLEKLLLTSSPIGGQLYNFTLEKFMQSEDRVSLDEVITVAWQHLNVTTIEHLSHEILNIIKVPLSWTKEDSYQKVKTIVHQALTKEIKRLGGAEFRALDYSSPDRFPAWFEALDTILKFVENQKFTAYALAIHLPVFSSPEFLAQKKTISFDDLMEFQLRKLSDDDFIRKSLVRLISASAIESGKYELMAQSLGFEGLKELVALRDNPDAWIDVWVTSDVFFARDSWYRVAYSLGLETGIFVGNLQQKLARVQSAGYQAIYDLFHSANL